MHFKNKFITHSEVYIAHSTIIEEDRSKGDVIYLRTCESTRIEMTIDKCYGNKIA
jgi:hypothetical protein